MKPRHIAMESKPISWSVGSNVHNDKAKKGFGDLLKESIDDVKKLHAENEKNTELLATGRADNLHKIMIDSEKADIALQLMLQVRNKAIESYQEIMRMQI